MDRGPLRLFSNSPKDNSSYASSTPRKDTPMPSLTVLAAFEATNNNLAQLPDAQFMDIYTEAHKEHQVLKRSEQWNDEHHRLFNEAGMLSNERQEIAGEMEQMMRTTMLMGEDEHGRRMRRTNTFFRRYQELFGEEFGGNVEDYVQHQLFYARQLLDEYEVTLQKGLEVLARGLQVEGKLQKYKDLLSRMSPRASQLANNSMPGMKRKFEAMST